LSTHEISLSSGVPPDPFGRYAFWSTERAMFRRVHPGPGFRGETRRAIALGAFLALIGLGGCSNPLFPESEDRSQFAGYDRARDQTVPAYVEDAYGDRRPNLRGRLLTRE
jgi:hypothetical protein